LSQSCYTGDSFDFAGPDFITATDGFFGPEVADGFILRRVKAFDEPIGQQGAGIAGQGQCFLGNLLNSHTHGSIDTSFF
jgi:hypothetical protein